MKLSEVHDLESAIRYVKEGSDEPRRAERKNRVFVYLYGAGPKAIKNIVQSSNNEGRGN